MQGSKIKVLYVFGGEKASGAEIVIERLMSYNLDAVEPHLFVSPGRFADDLIKSGKPYPIMLVERLKKLNRSSAGKLAFYFNAIKNYFLISLLVIKYVKRNKIETVHANTVVPASYLIPAIIYSKIFACKRRWIWSDHDLEYFARLDHIFSRLCVSQFTKTLAVSNAVKQKYGNNRSVEVLYNGLDPLMFKPDLLAREAFRNQQNFHADTILFGIAATISPRKGQLMLINIFNELAVAHPHIFLVLAGRYADDTPQYSEEVRSALNESLCVRHIGLIDNMTEFYNGCDFVLNNSNKAESEPLGTTIYEAMACEKVVIASATGGTTEIIENGVDGFLFEAENEEELKKTITSVIVNTSLAKMKSAARQKVQRKFAIDSMVSNYNQILNPGYQQHLVTNTASI